MLNEVNASPSARPYLLGETGLCTGKRKRALIERPYSSEPQPVGAVYEAVNEFQAGNSPPDTGGVAAPSRKRCEATAAAQTGWLGLTKCFGMHSLEEVPFSTTINASPYRARATRPSASLKEASRLLLDVASTPPMSRGEWRAQFIHTFYDRAGFVVQSRGERKNQAGDRRP
jgi:hypothetical protein